MSETSLAICLFSLFPFAANRVSMLKTIRWSIVFLPVRKICSCPLLVLNKEKFWLLNRTKGLEP